MNLEDEATVKPSSKKTKDTSDKALKKSKRKNNDKPNKEQKTLKNKSIKVSKSKMKSKDEDKKTNEKDKSVKIKSATKSKSKVLKDTNSESNEKKLRKSKNKVMETQELTNESKDPSGSKKKVWVEVFRDGRENITHNHPFQGVKLREPGPLKRLVSRLEWSAKAFDRARVNPLDLPITHIRQKDEPLLLFRYLQTGGPVCRMPAECDELVNDIQWEHMKAGGPDVKYNFLVTFNALVYEGRGWTYQPDDPAPPAGKCIDVAFVGDFTNNKLPKVMKKAAEDLIDWGVYHYKIHCCHEIIPLGDQKPKENTENIPQESLSFNEKDVNNFTTASSLL